MQNKQTESRRHFFPHTGRMQHPQARLVPDGIWWGVFGGCISSRDIEILSAESKERVAESVRERVENPSTLFDESHDKKTAWVCIALHPLAFDDRSLHQHAEQLRLSQGELLWAAAGSGRLSFFESVSDAYCNNPLVITPGEQARREFSEAFCLAAECGHLEIVTHCFAPCICVYLTFETYCRAFCSAAKRGHQEIVKALIDNRKLVTDEANNGQIDSLLQYDNFAALREAMKNNAIETADYLTCLARRLIKDDIRSQHYVLKMISANNDEIFFHASKNGQIAVIECLIRSFYACADATANFSEEFPPIQKRVMCLCCTALNLAASAGNLVMFKYFLGKIEQEGLLIYPGNIQRVDLEIKYDDYRMFCEAAKNQRYEIIDCLLAFVCRLYGSERGRIVNEMVQARKNEVLRYAAHYQCSRIIYRMLEFPVIWDYAKNNRAIYGIYVDAYVDTTVMDLRNHPDRIKDYAQETIDQLLENLRSREKKEVDMMFLTEQRGKMLPACHGEAVPPVPSLSSVANASLRDRGCFGNRSDLWRMPRLGTRDECDGGLSPIAESPRSPRPNP